jgi:hypothetical protein
MLTEERKNAKKTGYRWLKSHLSKKRKNQDGPWAYLYKNYMHLLPMQSDAIQKAVCDCDIQNGRPNM